jgi:4-hydroxy-3-methylbut-2-enyl diphosphate reductase
LHNNKRQVKIKVKVKNKANAKTRIKTAKTAGFCFGVRRAIELAEKTVRGKDRIYTLGPIIHNPQEIGRLAVLGIKVVEKPHGLKNETIIVRTHGIPAGLNEKLKSHSLTVVDATCPFVKRAQEIVKRLFAKGFQVIIVGDKTHPEVVGLVSYAKGNCHVVERKADLTQIALARQVGVICQTTQSPENFREIMAEIRRRRPRAEAHNTICRATEDRQSDVRRLAKTVDVMIVVGGKNSGNTQRLAEIAREYVPTHHIETASELKTEWLKNAIIVGITAGASTPDWIIKDVQTHIKGI